MTTTQKTCKERISDHLQGRIDDFELFRKINFGSLEDFPDHEEDLSSEDATALEDIGDFFNYGLCFDWVPEETFDNQGEGFYRYQLSWGGPSDEFRFFLDGTIKYQFNDWFDGASVDVTDNKLVKEVFSTFSDIGMMELYEGRF